MKWLVQTLGKIFGIHFAPDNYVVPVLRFGRYSRVSGPGFFWILPFVERTLPSVKTSLHVGNFVFSDVLSKDNIPFRVYTTILFTFDPSIALKDAAAQLVQGGDELLQTIVRDFANRRLRRLVSTFQAEELARNDVMTRIEDGLARYLKYEMRILGLKPLKAADGGAMIKEIIAPEEFRHTMLDVKHDEAILEVLRNYPIPDLVQLLNQVIFANSLKGRSGDLALMMGSTEAMNLWPFIGRTQLNGHDSN